MKYPRNITIERIEKYLNSEQFSDVNMQKILKQSSSWEAIKLAKYSVPGLERITFKEAMKGNYEDCAIGVSFACIWSDKGEVLQGITGGGGDTRHVDYDLVEKAIGGEIIKLWIEVAANSMFGEGMITMIGPTNPDVYFTLKSCELVVFDQVVGELYRDLEVLLGIAKEMPEDSQLANDALFAANDIVNTIRIASPCTYAAAREKSLAFFKARSRNGTAATHIITAIGNCHIDTAWLWPYDETKRKVARSWATQCVLLEKFPKYTFAASQAQQFEWCENLYPDLFDKIKSLAKRGRFIPIGGTWVEMDCNIPSGESFCRQFLYGQKYFEKTFGFKSSVFWLPDTFGYAAQLPQIVKEAGLKYFFTQKLSWNNINKFPHTTFYWSGLDGTRVLTHFSPADTYTVSVFIANEKAQASVKDAVFMVKNNKDKQSSNKSLLLYGNGDGGGGPLKHMLERIERFGDISDMPAEVHFGHPEQFYEQLEATSHDLSTWHGELYFELHRGTYTSHAIIKKFNRKCEYLLRNIEMLWTFSIALGLAPNAKYPKDELDRLWKLQLLNQFHDVLPGSSINLVYLDATKFYEDIFLTGGKLQDEALGYLIDHKKAKSSETIFNPSNWTRKNILVEVSGEKYLQKCLQKTTDGKSGLCIVPEILPFSFLSLEEAQFTCTDNFKVIGMNFQLIHKVATNDFSFHELETDEFVIVASDDKDFTIDNGLITVVIDSNGRIKRFFDIENKREIIAPGTLANVFKYFEDIPLFWDAWDVEVYHLEKGWDAGMGKVSVIENGPLRAVLKVIHPLSASSTLEQKIIINAHSRQVIFENDVFWDENRKILKVQFPVDITSDMATYETQFGMLQRPTHSNNSWDMAKFEVCGHKFVDLSEFGYGVALLNDCKYGFSVRGSTISMSLLRAPKAPDDKCDIGRHTFSYALQPHVGSFLESEIVKNGYEFNCPLIRGVGELKSPVSSFFTSSSPNLVIDTIKISESGEYTTIRLYEAMGGRGTATISCCLALKEVFKCNILEEITEECRTDINRRSFDIQFTPFKIITVLVKFITDLNKK